MENNITVNNGCIATIGICSTPSYKLSVDGYIKSVTTDALLILLSKSNNISNERKDLAQKIIDAQSDIEFLNDELKNKKKLFSELEKQFYIK